MGSVDYSETCPQCKNPDMQVTSYYKTGEEDAFCDMCGYGYTVTNNKNEEHIGYGAYTLWNKGFGQSGTLPEDPVKRKAAIKELLQLREDKKDMKLTLTEADGDKIRYIFREEQGLIK